MTDNTNKASLWVNNKAFSKDGKNHPILKGNIDIDGKVFDLALWLPNNRDGNEELAELQRDALGLFADYCKALGGKIDLSAPTTGGRPVLSGKISIRETKPETRRRYAQPETDAF
jgi:hypothetical protein